MQVFIRLSLLLLISSPVSWCQYDVINVVPGTRMSVNDDLCVSASNAFCNFAVLMHPFRNASAGGSVSCNMRYNTTDRFVHSVAVLGIAKNSTNAEQFLFVFTAEQISTHTPYVCIGTIIKSTCASTYACTDMGPAGSHQEYFLIGVDKSGLFAYGFASTFVFKLDIYANRIVLNLTRDEVWPSLSFIPHAVDVADTWAVVAGYGYADEYRQNYAALGCLIDLSRLLNASCIPIASERSYLIPSNVLTYNELYELSVAIRGQKVLIGLHRLASVVVLYRNASALNVTHTHILSFISSPSVGRVIDWADDTTMAILVQDAYETTWSRTQIFFYRETAVTMTSPLFTFPNNQQVLGSRLAHPSFARFSITATGNMAILTSQADVVIIPLAPAGYVSTWIDTMKQAYLFFLEPKPCINGTYKNHSSLGPCQICPTRTRNPGTSTDGVLRCLPCSSDASNSFCPLASLVDTNLTTIASYSQAVAYPETTVTTDIDDLLIENVFQMGSNAHCLVVSPLLWTLVVGGLCCLFLIFMLATFLFDFKSCIPCIERAKILFKHTDIIGEGELWLGGLATMAILVLVIFAYHFSAAFLRRYPLENISKPATFACDQSLVNARFSTGLELLDIPKSPDAQPMFDLLDKQVFNLTVELVNTGFPCSAVTVQENLVSSKYVPLPISCQQVLETATTSVTFSLPRYMSTVQINISGPFWIGAVRLCIRGRSERNGSYTLRELDFCTLYATANQALGRSTDIPVVFVKNINMTQALNKAGPTLYSGLWMPTCSAVSLSDENYYMEFGNYLRYTTSLTILRVQLNERPYYIKNIQQPVVRTAELVFHNLLFTSLCIELFGLSFLFVKLCIVPLCRWFVRVRHRLFHRKVGSSGSSASSDTLLRAKPPNHHDHLWEVDTNSNDRFDSDSVVSSRL